MFSFGYILYRSFEPDPFPRSKILITPTGSADSKNSIDGNRNKNETLNKVCIPVREFQDQINLTRMKTVIEKGIKNLTPLKDQERIIVRRAFSFSLSHCSSFLNLQ